ncbi:Putative esterase, fig/349521.5.peg.5248 homolog [hydrothermal vent metagenome]|uniref:Putative esterase, fig/349521.5.peg.5248 homolog n=1 Tax=hydrothermal vent metagenome TaxID=652676 RepID=A0A1W1BGM8_9ZZZZ
MEMLKKYECNKIEFGKYLLLVQKGDDVLDYRDAIKKIPNAKMIIEERGTHQFERIERHFEKIKDFFEFL